MSYYALAITAKFAETRLDPAQEPGEKGSVTPAILPGPCSVHILIHENHPWLSTRYCTVATLNIHEPYVIAYWAMLKRSQYYLGAGAEGGLMRSPSSSAVLRSELG